MLRPFVVLICSGKLRRRLQPQACHPERSEGSAFAKQPGEKQIPCCCAPRNGTFYIVFRHALRTEDKKLITETGTDHATSQFRIETWQADGTSPRRVARPGA